MNATHLPILNKIVNTIDHGHLSQVFANGNIGLKLYNFLCNYQKDNDIHVLREVASRIIDSIEQDGNDDNVDLESPIYRDTTDLIRWVTKNNPDVVEKWIDSVLLQHGDALSEVMSPEYSNTQTMLQWAIICQMQDTYDIVNVFVSRHLTNS